MRRTIVVLMIALVLAPLCVLAQLVSGPMLGPVTHRTTTVWLELDGPDAQAELRFWPDSAGRKAAQLAERIDYTTPGHFQPKAYNIRHYALNGMEPGTKYSYEVVVTPPAKNAVAKKQTISGSFTTQALWQWRAPAPDFSFLAGSCSYVNEPRFDRPGRPYGSDNGIFETMAKEKANFMLWLGDNWYLRDVDYNSTWGVWYRPHRDRSQPGLQNFLRSMPHIAIWDDHDYGPNDYGSSYYFKNESREVFRQYWLNQSYGDGQRGIYTRYQFNDVDLFMLDDRTWRDFDDLADSIGGKPNPNKHMLGRQQLNWLKQELLYSKTNPFISFRLIVVGSQVLNPGSPFDKLLDFPAEYYELMDFIRSEKIPGIVFLSGDRHHSEVIKVQHEGIYPLYDITCSPLSSGTHTFGGAEANNPWRVVGVDKYHNFGRFSVSGAAKNRQLRVDFVGTKGEQYGTWTVNENELKWASK